MHVFYSNNLQNKYTKVGKCCFNLNRQANFQPQSACDDMREKEICGNVCLSIYLFTGIPVTIYSTIELSDSFIVLEYPSKSEG